MARSPLTKRGEENLRAQLKELKTVERPRITAAIAEARAHGDLSENAEYHAAREQQSFVEGRIQLIETTLADSEIIDVNNLQANGRVVFGATVTVENLESEEQVTYQIVGEIEADIEQKLISITSPIARALIGKEEGDIVDVNAPSGNIEYEIVEVKYI